MGVTHRDIKPENLLLDGRFQLKVADFGLAAMRDSANDLLKTECGTRSYMAPEVLARRKYDGKKTDCWSIGVVLFILLSGNPPFQIARADQYWWFMQLVQDRPDRFWRSLKRYYPNFPQGPQKLITDMFNPDPAKRLSVEEVSKHPWVNADLMTPDEIYAEMSERKLKVDADKRAEKEKALAKKAAKAKNNQNFDPFNKDVHLPSVVLLKLKKSFEFLSQILYQKRDCEDSPTFILWKNYQRLQIQSQFFCKSFRK